jgi:type IV pilus assembly protein PilX
MMTLCNRRRESRLVPRQHQAGAVLYVALIMLILLALIGIVGMQVAGMQERMSANYRAVNLAFQNTEALTRVTECGLEVLNEIPRPGCAAVSAATVQLNCEDGYDASGAVRELTMADAPWVNVRQIEQCIDYEAAIEMGTPERPLPIYQITTYQSDDDTATPNPSSVVALDTIFRL